MKNAKVILVGSLLSTLLVPSLSFADNSSVLPTTVKTTTQKVVVFSEDNMLLQSKLNSVGDVDKDTKNIIKNFSLEAKTKDKILSEEIVGPVVVPFALLKNDSKKSERINKMIEKKGKVFIYGDDIKIEDIYKELNLPTNHTDDETTYNIIGLDNGFASYMSNITADDYNGNPMPITSDMVVQNVLRYLDESESSPSPIDTSLNKKKTKDDTGLTPSSMPSEDIQITPMSYEADTIVKSSYNNTTSFYAADVYGNNILRASLNTDWILKRNTSNDQDSKYDYFYIRDNSELYTNTSKAAYGWGIHIDHSLPYASSDNLLEWDPETKTDATNLAVSLPWAVQWQFNIGSEALDVYTNGSQTTDTASWNLLNNSIVGIREKFTGDYTRLQPGFAWASAGTLASVDINHVASFYFGTTYKELYQTFNVRYDY